MLVKKLLTVIAILLAAGLLYRAYQYYYPALTYLYPRLPAPSQANQGQVKPLTVPPGFSLAHYASGLSAPRDLEFAPAGILLVSEPSQGRIVALPDKIVVVSGLNRPHGLAFARGRLYVAETNAVAIYDYDPTTHSASNRKKIIDLPSGGGHWTRSLLVKDNQLYISIGSSCNVCRESNPRRAAVYVANLDGTNFRPFASGLRNSVFMAAHPQTGAIWTTDMVRDNLGDNLPPDEINILETGKSYGWPVCYGQNMLDRTFEKNEPPLELPQGMTMCEAAYHTTASYIDLPAHSAPLGLAFIPNSWPTEYRGDLLVAYHGSWNRSTPTGYKIVIADPQTKLIQDFITGFIPSGAQSGSEALGRPVDLIFDQQGRLYISDDKSGSVYLVTPPPAG